MTSIITRHLSDHHAVQGEAEYVERHAPVTASHTPPQKEASMTTYMQRDGRITSAATDDMPERIWLIPNAGNDGETVWCDDPAPGADMDPDDAVEYRRADLCASGQVRALEARNEHLREALTEIAKAWTAHGYSDAVDAVQAMRNAAREALDGTV